MRRDGGRALRRNVHVTALALLAMAIVAPAHALRYQAKPLEVLNGYGFAINAAGVIVGRASITPYAFPQAFFYDQTGVHFALSDPFSTSSADAINASGVAAGSVKYGLQYIPNAVTFEGTTHTYLGSLGGAPSVARGINDRSQVVGVGTTFDGDQRAFLSVDSKMRDLGTLGGRQSNARGINNASQIVGAADVRIVLPVRHAFVMTDDAMHDLGTLGGPNSEATAINAIGQVAGTSDMPSGLPHAFLFASGRMRDLGSLGGGYSEAPESTSSHRS